jgi:hypothetical protein
LNNIHPAARAENAINALNFLRHFHTVALSQTSRRDQYLSFALRLRKLAQHTIGFFFCGADKSAGVHDQHSGFIGVIH